MPKSRKEDFDEIKHFHNIAKITTPISLSDDIYNFDRPSLPHHYTRFILHIQFVWSMLSSGEDILTTLEWKIHSAILVNPSLVIISFFFLYLRVDKEI